LHGYHENAGREHAEDYLATLGIHQAKTPDEASHQLESANIAYLSLHDFAPQAEIMIGWKARYGLRTPINTVVRALNPGNAKVGIRGSFHPGFQQLHAEVEDEIGLTSHAVLSFKGVSGESEYNPKVSQTVWLSTDNQVKELYWPECFSDDIPLPEECILGTSQEDMLLMANTVIATMTAVLFTLELDRELAQTKAHEYWRRYIAG
jgi:anthranilate phosphoribosyltransferase